MNANAGASTPAPRFRYVSAAELPDYILDKTGFNASSDTLLRVRRIVPLALPAPEADVLAWWPAALKCIQARRSGQ